MRADTNPGKSLPRHPNYKGSFFTSVRTLQISLLSTNWSAQPGRFSFLLPPNGWRWLKRARFFGIAFMAFHYFLGCGVAHGETEVLRVLSLSRALEIAVDQEQDVVGAKADIFQARAQRLGALAAFLPTLSLSNQGQFFQPVGQSYNTIIAGAVVPAQRGFYNNAVTANLGLDLFAGGKHTADYRAASHMLNWASARLVATVNDTFMRVLKAYATLAKDEAAIEAQTEILRLAGNVARLTEARFQHRVANRIEWNRAIQQVLKAEMELSLARREAAEDTAALLQAMGYAYPAAGFKVAQRIPSAPDVEAAGPMQPPPDPGIRAAYAQLQAAREKVRSARAAYWPSISAVAQYNWLGIDANNPLSAFSATQGSNYTVGFAIRLPLLPIFDTMASVRSAEAGVQRTLGVYENTLSLSTSQLQAAIAIYREAKHTVEIAELSAATAGDNIRLYEALFKGRQGDYIDIDQSRMAAVQSRLAAATARSDLQLAAWNLYRLTHPELFSQALVTAAQRPAANPERQHEP